MLKRLSLFAVVACVAAGGLTVAAQGGYAAKPKTLKLHQKSGLGKYIVDASGKSLYLFEKDKTKASKCYGSCAKVWAPLLTTGTPTAGTGLTASKLGTSKRTDGTTQVTYGGHPLYHYDDDHKAGQTTGQGSSAFGAKWYVVGANGKKIDKS
jgi:predicted lipoprotein with Yx(FWY)xxD motif